ncbi:hypothetical protein JOB18_025047 [Solea senegalensis]|uniref:G-protein coupled receptors family 1 profile domain-containing protein n=1 Tax=Solea senegalensis TaxID=28829 RepID=A0AAV6QXL5_SOLSE|nr:hypothetical protein JOB18_025047 [Solea senegalensis]
MSLPPSSNLSLHPPPPSLALILTCSEVTLGTHLFAAASCTYLLVFLPLSVFILHLGLQKRRGLHPAATSNTDFFAYNIILIEVIAVLGCCFYLGGAYTYILKIKLVGNYFFFILIPAQSLFHVLTCLERYLAVIHPVFYLSLRISGGVKLRNVSTGLVWGISCGWLGLMHTYRPVVPVIPIIAILIFSVAATLFFSLAVLLALIRPGPGAGTGERADRLKRRAFHTIVVITGVVLLRLSGTMCCILLSAALKNNCTVLLSLIWFCLPSSYVLPLLFLHRAGKLPCFKYDTVGSEEREQP